MVEVKTNLTTKESARKLRVEPTGALTQTNVQKALEQIFSGIYELIREVTSGATVDVSSSEAGVGINKTVGSSTIVNLPASASRLGKPTVVVDIKGDAATNNITIVPTGIETVAGATSETIANNFGARELVPLPGGAGYYLR